MMNVLCLTRSDAIYFLFPFEFSFDLDAKVIHSLCVVSDGQWELDIDMVTRRCSILWSKLQSEPVFYAGCIVREQHIAKY